MTCLSKNSLYDKLKNGRKRHKCSSFKIKKKSKKISFIPSAKFSNIYSSKRDFFGQIMSSKSFNQNKRIKKKKNSVLNFTYGTMKDKINLECENEIKEINNYKENYYNLKVKILC